VGGDELLRGLEESDGDIPVVRVAGNGILAVSVRDAARDADIVPVMFKRELDTHQFFFAFGEALAHLHALWYAGSLRRERGDDRVYRFLAV